jgi:phage terminase large subunit
MVEAVGIAGRQLLLEGRMSTRGCSGGGVTSLLTTNPCDTEHWLYRDYVSNPLPGHAYWRQGARENPYLTKEYYDNLEAIYRDRPEIKRRYIDGEWGAIFSGKPVYGNEFNHDFHVSKEHLKPVAAWSWPAGGISG